MILKHVFLSTLMFFSFSGNTYSQDRIGWGDIRQPTNPIRPANPVHPIRPITPVAPIAPQFPSNQRQWNQNLRTIEITVNRYTTGLENINLLDDYYVREQLQGKTLRQVSVTAATEYGFGKMALLVNGTATDMPVTVSRDLQNYELRVPAFNPLVQRLELQVHGNFFVQNVRLVVDERNIPNVPRIETLRQQLNEQIRGEGGLTLERVFNLGQEKYGKKLARVHLVASALRPYAQAELKINGVPVSFSQSINYSQERLTFEVMSLKRIGIEVQRTQIQVRGDVIIHEIAIELENNDNHYPPIPGPITNRIEQIINQRIYDNMGTIHIHNLMAIDYRLENRNVESVELIIRGSDYGTLVKLCQELNASNFPQYGSMNCGFQQTLFPGNQIIRLSPPAFTKLRELSLSVRLGMVDIEKIIVNLQY